MIRIAQLSDIHISADGTHPRGIDVRTNFQRALTELDGGEYDLVVLSGDLAATRDHAAAYDWIRVQIDDLSIPTLCMAGNHDDRGQLARSLRVAVDPTEGDLRARRRLDGVTVYALDTSTGHLPESQLSWLERWVGEDDQLPVIFMHHPPVDCGCRFMDRRMPLLNRQEVWRRLSTIAARGAIFCGHYHTHKVVLQDGVSTVLCPSTELQIARNTDGFEVEHQRPGYLEIEASDRGLGWTPHYFAEGATLPG